MDRREYYRQYSQKRYHRDSEFRGRVKFYSKEWSKKHKWLRWLKQLSPDERAAGRLWDNAELEERERIAEVIVGANKIDLFRPLLMNWFGIRRPDRQKIVPVILGRNKSTKGEGQSTKN